MRQCIEQGLVSGKHLTVDSTLVKANASFKSLEPIVVALKPEQYLAQVEQDNPVIEEQKASDEEPWEPKDDFHTTARRSAIRRTVLGPIRTPG